MTATIVLILRIGLAITLYIFLWRVLQTLWRDLKQQGIIVSTPKKMSLHLDAVMENGDEAKYNFRQGEIVIGRGMNCDISLTDDALSAHHAKISHHHTQWWLEDLGSTNGTFLNKTQISIPTVITSDDVFKCGNTTFTLRVDSFDNRITSNTQNQNGD